MIIDMYLKYVNKCDYLQARKKKMNKKIEKENDLKSEKWKMKNDEKKQVSVAW